MRLVSRRRDLLLLCALAAVLLLPNLGGPRLWADEGDTAVFARTIVERGLPFAWDGRTFTESDRGRRLNGELLMVGTPWLPYYLAAGSFAALGESAFSARLPFALCGVAAVALLYLLVAELTRDRRAAVCAALLLLASVQFLLFARQCRHYAPDALLSVAVLLGFARLRHRPRSPAFAAASVLLFHTHPLPAAASLAAAGAGALHPEFRGTRRAFLAWCAVVGLGTVPWLAVSWTGWQENSSFVAAAAELPERLAQAAVESAEVVPLLGWALLAFAARRRLARGDGAFLALALPGVAAFVVLLALALSLGELFALGLRYAVGMLPLAAGVTGVLVARAAGPSRLRLGALLALFAATHVPGATALYLTLARGSERDQTGVLFHEPKGALGPWLRLEWLGYPRELVETDPGTVSHLVDFLGERARPDDLLVTNYEWEPLYFHLPLPQAYKVLPGYEILAAARARGLPDYVFDASGARWVVWRPPAEGYQGYRLADVRAQIAARGRRMEQVGTVPETVWENRPEIHYHRFPGLRYLYPIDVLRSGYGHGGPATIYRVDRDPSSAPGTP